VTNMSKKREPTRIVLDVKFTSDAESMRSEKLDKVFGATMFAFVKACEQQGVDCGHVVRLHCMTPKRFAAWNAHTFKGCPGVEPTPAAVIASPRLAKRQRFLAKRKADTESVSQETDPTRE
jgi:hypothetical protein